LKEGVELISQRPREAIIRGSVIANGIQNARLEGFQIRGGALGVGIRDSDVILSRDEIADARGAGVEFDGNSRGAIFACDIHNNSGAGIVVSDAAAPAIENNLVRDNGSQPGVMRPGLFIRSTLRPSVVANVFSGNGAEAIWLPAADESMIQRSYFVAGGSMDRHPAFRIVPLQEGKP
jgi:parallel beta-helix repeat protein